MFEPCRQRRQAADRGICRSCAADSSRLIEMMQIKGNSEVHRKFWPADEFADFENGDSVATFSGRTFKKENFVRWAVAKGLDYQAQARRQPLSSSASSAAPTTTTARPGDVVEDNYIGSHGPADGTVKERREGEIDGWIKAKDSNPGSLTGVWATKNTRAAIWDAHGRARELRDLGHAHQGALLRRGRSARPAHRPARDGGAGLQERRADGRHGQRRRPRRRPSPSGRRRTPTAPTSTASRSSRAGWTRRASRRTR